MSEQQKINLDALDYYINSVLVGVNKRKITIENSSGSSLGFNRPATFYLPANDNIIGYTESYWLQIQPGQGCNFLRNANNFVTGKRTKVGNTTLDDLTDINIISTKLTDYIDHNRNNQRKLNQLAQDLYNGTGAYTTLATNSATATFDSAGQPRAGSATAQGNMIWVKATFPTGFLATSPSLIPTSQTGPIAVQLNFADPTDVMLPFDGTVVPKYTINNARLTLQAAQIFDGGAFEDFLKRYVAEQKLKIPYFTMQTARSSLKAVGTTQFVVDSMCINKLLLVTMADNSTKSVIYTAGQTNTFKSDGTWWNANGRSTFKIQNQYTGDPVTVQGEVFEDTCHALALDNDSTEAMRTQLVTAQQTDSEFVNHSWMHGVSLSLSEDPRDLAGVSTKDTNGIVYWVGAGASTPQVTPILYAHCTQIANILPNRNVIVDA